jgi:hypothetical protein
VKDAETDRYEETYRGVMRHREKQKWKEQRQRRAYVEGEQTERSRDGKSRDRGLKTHM